MPDRLSRLSATLCKGHMVLLMTCAGLHADPPAAEAVEEGAMDQLIGHSITYRIAVGPQAGRKVFTLQTLPASEEPFDDPVVGNVENREVDAPPGEGNDGPPRIENPHPVAYMPEREPASSLPAQYKVTQTSWAGATTSCSSSSWRRSASASPAAPSAWRSA